MRKISLLLVIAPALLELAACKKKPPTPPVSEDEFFPGHKHVGGGDDGGDEMPDWVPAEFKKGAGRWKDTGVYVDGKPVGMLSFGELPVKLEPVWVEEKVSANKNPGDNSPGWKLMKSRRYRFADYLEALGLDVAKIKEVHVYGPKLSATLIASGPEIQARRQEFMFRFAGDIDGKAIAVIPANFGNRMRADKISSVMIYLEKKPPTLVRNEGMVLDGDVVEGVPYRGEPLRGGIRLYFDDRLLGLIKRNALDGTLTGREETPDGHIRWKLFPFLDAQNIPTKQIVEAWVTRDDRRREHFTKEELESMSFEAAPQKRGEILLGEKKIRAHHLSFFSKPATLHEDIQDSELSYIE